MKKLLCLILALSLLLCMSLVLVSCSSDDEEEKEDDREIVTKNDLKFAIPKGFTLMVEDEYNSTYVDTKTGSSVYISVQKTIRDMDDEFKGPLYDSEAEFLEKINASTGIEVGDVKIKQGVDSQVITYSATTAGIKVYTSMTIGIVKNTVMHDGVERYEYTTYTVTITSTDPDIGTASLVK